MFDYLLKPLDKKAVYFSVRVIKRGSFSHRKDKKEYIDIRIRNGPYFIIGRVSSFIGSKIQGSQMDKL